MFDLYVIENAIEPDLCSRLVSFMSAAEGEAAVVYGGGSGKVVSGIRQVTQVAMPGELINAVRDILGARMNELSEHFGTQLRSFEPPQFLRYSIGDHFVAHQDGNTPPVHDDTRFRKVSVVIFLNDPEAYAGGSLVLHGKYPDFDRRHPVPSERGTLATFRSETTHEVTPVSKGLRFTIVSWYR